MRYTRLDSIMEHLLLLQSGHSSWLNMQDQHLSWPHESISLRFFPLSYGSLHVGQTSCTAFQAPCCVPSDLCFPSIQRLCMASRSEMKWSAKHKSIPNQSSYTCTWYDNTKWIQMVTKCDKTLLHNYVFHFLSFFNIKVPLMLIAKIQPNIPSGSEEEKFICYFCHFH